MQRCINCSDIIHSDGIHGLSCQRLVHGRAARHNRLNKWLAETLKEINCGTGWNQIMCGRENVQTTYPNLLHQVEFFRKKQNHVFEKFPIHMYYIIVMKKLSIAIIF
jgi:hypothetical protein